MTGVADHLNEAVTPAQAGSSQFDHRAAIQLCFQATAACRVSIVFANNSIE